jgi:hypothetical protein
MDKIREEDSSNLDLPSLLNLDNPVNPVHSALRPGLVSFDLAAQKLLALFQA